MNGDDAFDDADRHRFLFERAALLDVQLDIAVERARSAPGVGNSLGMAADAADPLGLRETIPALVELAWDRTAGGGAAAVQAIRERAALLVRPDHHFERMIRDERTIGDSAHHFDRRQHAEVAVEVATARHRVDVGPEQDGRQIGPLARPCREDVAGGVDPRLRPRSLIRPRT